MAHSSFLNERLRLDLHEHRRIDERSYFDHAGRRPDVLEVLAVYASNGFPVAGDVHHVHARPNHIAELGAGVLKRRLDVLHRLTRLRGSVIVTDNLAVRAGCRRPRHVDVRAESNGAGVADDRLPRGAGRDMLLGWLVWPGRHTKPRVRNMSGPRRRANGHNAMGRQARARVRRRTRAALGTDATRWCASECVGVTTPTVGELKAV